MYVVGSEFICCITEACTIMDFTSSKAALASSDKVNASSFFEFLYFLSSFRIFIEGRGVATELNKK